MKRLIFPLVLIVLFMTNCTQEKKSEKLQYPETRKTDVTDDYFGKQIADPYRWLENDTAKETEEWVKKQNQVTQAYLDKISFRGKLKEKLTEVWNYEKYTTPFQRGDRFFYFKNDGLQNQDVLYMTKDPGKEGKVLLDPNKLSEDGTVALSGISISHGEKYLAYAISRGGSDWKEIYVRNIETGKNLEDHIEWVKFSGMSWFQDGFFYSSYDEPEEGKELSNVNKFHKVYYHKIGTPQSNDKLVHENPDAPRRNYYAQTTRDERFLILTETESTSGNALYARRLGANKEFVQIAQGFDNDYSIVGNLDNHLLMLTNDEAPNYRLVAVDMNKPARENWKTILPEKDYVLRSIELAGGKIVASYMKDAHSKLEIYSYKGEPQGNIELPALGTVGSFNGEEDKDLAFYSFSSYTFPNVIYKYDMASGTSEVFRKPSIDVDTDNFVTEQVFYTSKDGTKIPMFITHKKGIERDGNNPALLYGYGGFNISLTPSFSAARMVWLEAGGVYAVANLRGGGEYGEEWHKQGTKMNKQNVFDDFIAAAEYLTDKGYTSSENLAIQGGSNGGLLVGAVVNQRPGLFAAAIPAVGVMDMLRYHKFTIGWAWATDYGTSEDSKEMFDTLYSYSPVHNVVKGKNYPAIMVLTADHDDRVVPAHSFKYIAQLQDKYKGPNPVIIRIETKAGHGAGKPTSKRIQEAADIYGFIFENLKAAPKF